GICLYFLLEFGFGIDVIEELAKAVGRDPTLTGRTEIWTIVLGMHTDPLVGTGYESFWLGPRLKLLGGINEAHNGYIEVYLHLGLIGLFLMVGFLIASYRIFCRKVRSFSNLGLLSLTLWSVLLFYNATESALKVGLMWIAFLLGVITVPRRSRRSPSQR